jgi:HPr kinase/phosphorylase
MSQISILQLFEAKKNNLGLSWQAGKGGDKRLLSNEAMAQSTQGIIGHLNFIHPNWIQVLSNAEVNYLNQLGDSSLENKLKQLVQSDLVCIIFAENTAVPDSMREISAATETPLFCSSSSSSLEIIWQLRTYLARVLALSTSMHGVLLDVLGMGVLVTGESGVGKSELALELISRGHGFVADDVVELRRIAPETLEGQCPDMLRDFLEVRGLGVLNIRTIFGETAVRRRKNMKLIVHLQRSSDTEANMERLPISNLNESIMNVDVRKVIIPVAAGRNLAVLVEAAVRNYVLQLRGIDSTQDFIERQQQVMDSEDNNQSNDNSKIEG